MAKKEKSGNWFRRHKVLTVILVIILIAIIASAAGGKKDAPKSNSAPTSSSSSSSQASEKAPASLAKIGEPVRDGKFEFTVTKIQCGVTEVGTNPYLSKQPQGQFCLLSLTVKNIGTAQQYFSQDDQKLLDAASVQYSYDATATLYNSNNQDAFGSQINPGNSVVGVLVYDIPKDKTPVTAELHDSSLSNGVKVSLQ